MKSICLISLLLIPPEQTAWLQSPSRKGTVHRFYFGKQQYQSTSAAPYSTIKLQLDMRSHKERDEKQKKQVKESYGEKNRKFRRTVYGHDDWLRHRSSERFSMNFQSILRSDVFRQLLVEVGAVTSMATKILIWNGCMLTGWIGFDGSLHEALLKSSLQDPTRFIISIPGLPFLLSSPSLGLLLVFRTNSSYARWGEARATWGKIITQSGNIVRMASNWSSSKLEPDIGKRKELLQKLAKSVWSFPRSLQAHVSGPDDLLFYEAEIREKLDPIFADTLMHARHRPNRALYEISQNIEALPVTRDRKIEMDRCVVNLEDCCGVCERIFSSPVPLVYTNKTAWFLYVWLLGLPFAFWEPFANTWNHLGMIPASGIISIFFFGQ